MRVILYSLLASVFFYAGISKPYKTDEQPSADQVYFADPTIFYQRGKYYLYGTDGYNADSGFHVLVSNDLLHWKKSTANNERALSKGKVYGTKGFWAPQVFNHHQNVYMAYTANENIAIAESDQAVGPFMQKNVQALDAPVKQIDPFIFKDDDGKLYLYHVRLQQGNRIFGAELKDDLSAILPATLQECISAVKNPQAWENKQTSSWTVTEGPTVIKRNGVYYMFYSANDFRNPDYAVGYATAAHPLGPWKKAEQNPIISKRLTGCNGSGHGDLITGKDGNDAYVFHTHFSVEKVAPRKTAIINISFAKNGHVTADSSSFRYLKYDR